MTDRQSNPEHRNWRLTVNFLALFLASATGMSSTLHAQAIDATQVQSQPAYTFPETKGMDFFKRDIRDRDYSTEYSEELMGRASRNGIVVGVFGDHVSILRQVEQAVGDAHRNGMPVAMAIANDTDSDPQDALVKVYEGGSLMWTLNAMSLATDIRPAVLHMVTEAQESRLARLGRLKEEGGSSEQ